MKPLFNIIYKILNFLSSRIFFVIIAFLFQFAIFASMLFLFKDSTVYFYAFEIIIRAVVILYIINDNVEPSFKIAWLIVIIFVPYLGSVFYFIFSRGNSASYLRKRFNRIANNTKKLLTANNSQIKNKVKAECPYLSGICRYLNNFGGFPVYENQGSEFFSVGEIYFKRLLEELDKAEKFIFIESFIIHEGEMWNCILEILKKKAASGVEVKILYDDFGCFFTLSRKYPKMLHKYGIESTAFNPIKIIFSLMYNNRNHCKICVIDGKTAFTGGINYGDEYINAKVRFGHWKDYGYMFKGEAVWSYTNIFLTHWIYATKRNDINPLDYKPEAMPSGESKGYIIPFSDSPLDNEALSHNIFTNIIDSANDYVYITTPYLILDNRLAGALIMAAKRGVDVRVMTPHIPDKKTVFQVTRGNYTQLIKNGVKVYEYTPGFLHAKSIISDDKIGVLGSINMDYRSLYLHFENGVILYNDPEILKVKQDHLEIIKISEQQTNPDAPFPLRILRSVLNVFAPLM